MGALLPGKESVAVGSSQIPRRHCYEETCCICEEGYDPPTGPSSEEEKLVGSSAGLVRPAPTSQCGSGSTKMTGGGGAMHARVSLYALWLWANITVYAQ